MTFSSPQKRERHLLLRKELCVFSQILMCAKKKGTAWKYFDSSHGKGQDVNISPAFLLPLSFPHTIYFLCLLPLVELSSVCVCVFFRRIPKGTAPHFQLVTLWGVRLGEKTKLFVGGVGKKTARCQLRSYPSAQITELNFGKHFLSSKHELFKRAHITCAHMLSK